MSGHATLRSLHVSAEMRRVLEAAEQQGFTVTRTRSGHVRVLAPGGERPYFLASTPSDWRSNRNALAALRRRGLDWPPDATLTQVMRTPHTECMTTTPDPDATVYQDTFITEYADGTEAVRFSDAEWAAMAADPVRFGLARPCGHPMGNGDCLTCEWAAYDAEGEYEAALEAADLEAAAFAEADAAAFADRMEHTAQRDEMAANRARWMEGA